MVTLLTSIKRVVSIGVASLCFMFGTVPAHALEQAQFDSLLSELQAEKFEPVATFLKQNSKLAKTDPDYSVLLLNHAFLANRKSQLIIAQGQAQDGDYELTKVDDPNIKGFMREHVSFDKDAVIKVIRQVQSNLQSFPEYLDIQVGIAVVSSRMGEWQIATDQLINLLKVSREIDNDWKWGKVGGMEGEPQEFMLESVLPYGSQLFRMQTPETDQLLVRLSETLIQYYPKKVYGYANLGSFYAVTGKKDKAREYYEKALEISPNDEVVRANLKKLVGL